MSMGRRQFLKAGAATAAGGAAVATGAIAPPELARQNVPMGGLIGTDCSVEQPIAPKPLKRLPPFAKTLLKSLNRKRDRVHEWQSDVHGLHSTSYAFKINTLRKRREQSQTAWDLFREKYKDYDWSL